MKKQIHYRSTVRGHSDNLIDDPEVVYFGFTQRVKMPNLAAQSNEITAKMEAMQQPCVVAGIMYFPATDRAVERYECFVPESDEVDVMVRVPFREVAGPVPEMN